MSVETYYSVLGLKEACSHAEIKAAYRVLVRQMHPDSIPNASPYWKQTAEEKTKELNEAYSVLSDTRKRREYDRLLAEARQATPSQSAVPPYQSSRHQPSQSRYSQQPNAQQQPTGASRSSQAQTTVARKSKTVLQGLGIAYVCLVVVACLVTALANLWFALSCSIGLGILLLWRKFAKNFPVVRRWVIGLLVVCAGFLIVDLTHSSRRSEESSSVQPSANTSSPRSRISSVPAVLTASPDTMPKDARFIAGRATTNPRPETSIFNVNPMKGYGEVKPFMGTQCSWNNVSAPDKRSALENGSMPSHTFMISPGNETCYVLSNDVPTFLAMGAVRGEPVFKAGRVIGYVRGTGESRGGHPLRPLPPMHHDSDKSNPEIAITGPSVQVNAPVSAETHVSLPQLERSSMIARSDHPGTQPESGHKLQNLSGLSYQERSSAEAACVIAYSSGPAAYNRCLSKQLEEWKSGPKQPDLSGLSYQERSSAEAACVIAYSSGPAAYNRCLLQQLQSLNN